MSDLDRYASERSEKTATKESFEPDLFNSLSDTDLQRDSTSIRIATDLANKALIRNGILGNVTIFDSTGDTNSSAQEKPAQKTADVSPKTTDAAKPVAEPRPGSENPSDQRQMESRAKPDDGKKDFSLEFDEKGQPERFTDRNGDVFKRDKDGKWYRTNLMLRQEVKLTVSEDGTVTIKYPQVGDKGDIVRSIKKDGTELTRYPDGSGTTRKQEGDKQVITVENEGKRLQTLTLDKAGNLIQFESADGTKYRQTGKDKWQVVDKSGNTSEFKGTIKADGNGTVSIRKQSPTGSDTDVVRYLNNGTKVQSDIDGRVRKITSSDGLTITDDKNSGTRSYKYPNGAGELVVRFDKDGNPRSVEGTANGQRYSLEKNADGKWIDKTTGKEVKDVEAGPKLGERFKSNDSIRILLEGSKVKVIDSKGNVSEHSTFEPRFGMDLSPQGRKLEDTSIVDEMPPEYKKELEERVKELEQFKRDMEKRWGMSWENLVKYALLGPAGVPGAALDQTALRAELYKKLFDLTRDGGRFDDKQKGQQYQKWGNFAFGVYARALGLTVEEALGGTFAYKYLQGKPRDPQDYRDIRRGIDFYDSGRRTA